MHCVIDGFEFCLSKDSTIINVFKGDAFVTYHQCESYEEAKEIFEKIRTKKKVYFELGDKTECVV